MSIQMTMCRALGFALLLATGSLQAADVPCEVGAQVEGDDIAGGETGEIVEIGTERPHVGWYKIKFSYSSGEWFNPKMVTIHPTGTGDRCVVMKAVPSPAPAPAPAPEESQTDPAATPEADASLAITAKTLAGLPAGAYSCSAGVAGGSFKITLKDGGTYSDRAGTNGRYAVDAAGKVNFSSGSLKGQNSKVLGRGKFGLSSDSASFFATVCNLKN